MELENGYVHAYKTKLQGIIITAYVKIKEIVTVIHSMRHYLITKFDRQNDNILQVKLNIKKKMMLKGYYFGDNFTKEKMDGDCYLSG